LKSSRSLNHGLERALHQPPIDEQALAREATGGRAAEKGDDRADFFGPSDAPGGNGGGLSREVLLDGAPLDLGFSFGQVQLAVRHDMTGQQHVDSDAVLAVSSASVWASPERPARRVELKVSSG
jgi:hypothetical protein